MDEDARDFTATGSRQTRFAPRNLVDADEISRICKRLDAIRTRSDLLFDPLVSLPKLANAVGATSNQLSYVLNQHLGKSFFDFINEVRTGEASRLLVNEPDRTILDIANSHVHFVFLLLFVPTKSFGISAAHGGDPAERTVRIKRKIVAFWSPMRRLNGNIDQIGGVGRRRIWLYKGRKPGCAAPPCTACRHSPKHEGRTDGQVLGYRGHLSGYRF